MRIVQLVPAAEGWRALHYDVDDDEVYEVPLVAFALVERDEVEVCEAGGSPQEIHAVGMYDLPPSVGQGELFTFTDQDSTFIELAAPEIAYTDLNEAEPTDELIERIRRFGKQRAGRACAEEPAVATNG